MVTKKSTKSKKTIKKTSKKDVKTGPKVQMKKKTALPYMILGTIVLLIALVWGVLQLGETNPKLAEVSMLTIDVLDPFEIVVSQTGETFFVYKNDLKEVDVFYRLEGYEESTEDLIEQVAIRNILFENARYLEIDAEQLESEKAYMSAIIESLPQNMPELQNLKLSKKELQEIASLRLERDIRIQEFLNEKLLPHMQLDEALEGSHILICHNEAVVCENNRTREEALAKITEIKNNVTLDTFAEFAATFSDDPGSEDGYLGVFRRGMMVPEFESVAFATQPETISNIVETDFGYHIIAIHGIEYIPNEAAAAEIQFQLLTKIREVLVIENR